MDRNLGAPNRRIPPDVQPKGSTSRDLEREEEQDRDGTPETSDVSEPDYD